MEERDPFPVRSIESETADYIDQFGSAERRRLVSQGVRHYAGQVAAILSSVILVPVLLHQLGTQAYGFWLIALSTPGFASGLDNAIYFSITRETALYRERSCVTDESTSSFLSACCGAYIAFGILCGICILVAGNSIVRHLQLSSEILRAAPVIFGAVAIGFAAGRAVVFANAVMSGFQRFGTMNGIAFGALVARFFGFLVISTRYSSLRGIAVWYAVVAFAECATALGFAAHFGAVRANRSLLEWRRLTRVGDFGISTLLTTVFQNLFWLSPPILLGIFTGGTNATFTLYAGQRPGNIVSDLNWRGAEVVFSASATSQTRSRERSYEQLMIFGTSCILAVALPLCIGLAFLAPALISVWLRIPGTETVAVMRLTSVAVIADALWVGPLHVLWGRGNARSVLWISLAVAASALLLNVFLIPRYGAIGAAFTFALISWAAALVTMIVAARYTASSWIRSMVLSFYPVVLASICLAIFVFIASTFLHSHPRTLLVVGPAGGGPLYIAIVWLQSRKIKTVGDATPSNWLSGFSKYARKRNSTSAEDITQNGTWQAGDRLD